MAGSSGSERIPPAVEAMLAAMTDDLRAQVVDCIKYLREHPEPDGKKIFDIPIYPAMFRSMKCGRYAITFRMQNNEARLHAIAEDN